MVHDKNNNTEKSLVFTQTWFDFWFVVLFFCALLILGSWKFLTTLTHVAVFMYSVLQILVPVFFGFKYIAIRSFELTPEFISVTFGNKVTLEVPRSQIKEIKVEFIPAWMLFNRGRSEKIIFKFIYSQEYTPALKGLQKIFYSKKITVNHYLFLDKTSEVLQFLKEHYGDKVEIDKAVIDYVQRKNM